MEGVMQLVGNGGYSKALIHRSQGNASSICKSNLRYKSEKMRKYIK